MIIIHIYHYINNSILKIIFCIKKKTDSIESVFFVLIRIIPQELREQDRVFQQP